MFEHDFKKFPELTNNQMQFYYFDSPHRQITEDFEGRVVDIHDGDTIKVKWSEREKPVTIRLLYVASPELKEDGGIEARSWLEHMIEDKDVLVKIDANNRVGRFGRLLGVIQWAGMNINQMAIESGLSKRWGVKDEFGL